MAIISCSRVASGYARRSVLITAHAMLQRKSWTAELRAAVELRATKDSFIVTAHLSANQGNAEIIARSWEEKIPRDLV